MFRIVGAGVLLMGSLLLGGCIFGGGGDDDPPSATRPSSIPTATPPANLPEPVLLTQASPQPGAPGGAAPGTYVVKSGDSLFAIAASLGITGEALAPWTTEVLRLNQLADGASLRVGQELTLPVVRSPTPAAGAPTPARRPAATASTPTAGGTPAPTATRPTSGATPAATSTTGGGASSRTYTVVAGDYPLLIAQKLNVPEAQQNAWANELLSLNATTAAGLDVGDVLRLPASTP